MAACSVGLLVLAALSPTLLASERKAFLGDLGALLSAEIRAEQQPARPLDFYILQDFQQAQMQYRSGTVTTFYGVEFPGLGAQSTRTVVFQGNRMKGPSPVPNDVERREDLWRWQEDLRAAGIESLAIPLSDESVVAIDSTDAQRRERNEPLIGIRQTYPREFTQPMTTTNAYRFGVTSASGLTGVWAEENSREAVYAALRRGETFATSGPRFRLRMFAGFRFDENLHTANDMAQQALKRGVVMGGRLEGGRGTLMISAVATSDDRSPALHRLQVVKNAIKDGASVESIFDIAHSSKDDGVTRLGMTWRDPEFDRKQSAFYYVRAIASAGEHAVTSPIWYSPAD